MPGVWNRSGRRSGGNKAIRIPVVARESVEPFISFACANKRHAPTCPGDGRPVMPDKCTCPCHLQQGLTSNEA